MRVMLFFCYLLYVGQLTGQSHSTDYVKGLEAYEAGNYKEYLARMERAYQKNPEHDLIIFEHMKALTLNNRLAEARLQLSYLIERRSITVHRLYGEKVFEEVLNASLAARIRRMERPVLNSDTVHVITERDLILEGIAIDQNTGRKFVGSTYKEKIVAVALDGQFSDFSHREDSLWSILGMEVDEERGVLWAATAYSPGKTVSQNSGCSRLLKIDIGTGRLIKDYRVCNELLNDLTVTKRGDVFVTGTLGTILYRLDNKRNQLKPFLDFKRHGYRYLNGITLNHERDELYVAHETGVLVVDLPSGGFTELQKPADTSLMGIDGMSYYHNSLICHQRMLGSITRYLLSYDGKSVTGEEIIDANHPAFDGPTTGELGGDGYYYYLANTQIRSAYDTNGVIKPYKNLQDKIILRWKLPELH